MKHISIKTKVTLWYSSLVAILLLFVLVFLFVFTDKLLLQRYRNQLRSVVYEAAELTFFENDELNVDDVSFYKNEVSVFMYDAKGHLIAPMNNVRGYVNALLEPNHIKIVEENKELWMVYDYYNKIDGYPIWFRGCSLISNVYGTISMMSRIALISVPFFLLIASLGGYLITRKAFKPIDQIRQTAEKIEKGTDLTQRINIQNNVDDEVARLGKTFDRMFEKLYRSFQAEKQFTSDTSHELRTPVAIIIAQCEYALQNDNSVDEMRESLKSILNQSKKMSALIAQLLMLAKADQGKLSLEIEDVDLSELCEIIMEEMQFQAENENVHLDSHIEGDIHLMADHTLLLRMITNLLNNAIHYNKPDGKVELRLYQKGENCILEIEDNGIGIAQENLDKIWNRFYREPGNKHKSGTGLGLAMVKWIVKMHHGQIEAKSEINVGSLFIVKLPMKYDES